MNAHRKLRVPASRVQSLAAAWRAQPHAWRIGASRPVHFATRLLAAHEASLRAGVDLERTLVTPRASVVNDIAMRHEHFAFVPRIALTFAGDVTQHIGSGTSMSAHHERLKQTYELRTTNHVVERLLTRLERIDSVRETRVALMQPSPELVPIRAALAPATAYVPPVNVVTKVFRTEPVAAKAVGPAQTTTSSRGLTAPRTTQPAASIPATSIPAFDVDQLADRVVHVIDRRLTAMRERLGRV